MPMEMLLDQLLVPHFHNLEQDLLLEDSHFLPHLPQQQYQTHYKELHPAKEVPQLRKPTQVETEVQQVQVNPKGIVGEQEQVNHKEQPPLLPKQAEQVQNNKPNLLLGQLPQLELKILRLSITTNHQPQQDLKTPKVQLTAGQQHQQELKTVKAPSH
jgi:hypothetical protein